ncbi:MAG: hypothetical protein K2Q34_02830 [Alphaproteobacteria bacterium]|nr:hypothetical protein [Alphaproteobacteria bacterium]
MKLFVKIIATVFLAVVLSGMGMASMDFNDPNSIADDAKLGVVRPLVKAAPTNYPYYEITLDANLVDAFETLVNGNRFIGNGKQVKNLLEGLKALYSELAATVGGSDHLKEELDEQETPLIGVFALDLTLPLADYNNAENRGVIKRFKKTLGEHGGHDDHQGHGSDHKDCPIVHTKLQPSKNNGKVVLCRPCGSSGDLTELLTFLSLTRVAVNAEEVK